MDGLTKSPTPASGRVWEEKPVIIASIQEKLNPFKPLSGLPHACEQVFEKLLALTHLLYKNTACRYAQHQHIRIGPTMIKLTARQEQILNLIREAIENTGFPPTRAEIAAELGFRSANAAEEHLQALARKGAIEISPGTSRGIRLCDTGQNERPRLAGARQMALPHPSLMQLSLPLVGRVAAGSPILAQEHIEATYNVDQSLFSAKPDYLLKVRGLSMRDAGILDGDLLAVKKPTPPRMARLSLPD